MRYIEDFSDARQKAWCIHCGKGIEIVPANLDHVPTKSLLSKRAREAGRKYDTGQGVPNDYLPQVLICKECNAGFSDAENYLSTVLRALQAGSLNPDKGAHPQAHKHLKSNRRVVRKLMMLPDGQKWLFKDLEPFILYPDPELIEQVVLKNARGHIFHEIGEPALGPPSYLSFKPLSLFTASERSEFEAIGEGVDVWPEVGSRMMLRLVEGDAMAGGWVNVEDGYYRYAIDWSDEITVRTVIWDYLATETRWR